MVSNATDNRCRKAIQIIRGGTRGRLASDHFDRRFGGVMGDLKIVWRDKRFVAAPLPIWHDRVEIVW